LGAVFAGDHRDGFVGGVQVLEGGRAVVDDEAEGVEAEEPFDEGEARGEAVGAEEGLGIRFGGHGHLSEGGPAQGLFVEFGRAARAVFWRARRFSSPPKRAISSKAAVYLSATPFSWEKALGGAREVGEISAFIGLLGGPNLCVAL